MLRVCLGHTAEVRRVVWVATLALGLTGLWMGNARPAHAADEAEFSTGSTDELVSFINQQIRQTWSDNLVEPSAIADDAEWLRRVYLDIVGHIPEAEQVQAFLS